MLSLRRIFMGQSTLTIQQILANAAATYGVDANLVLAVATQESSLNPNAVNHSSGAAGLMQLLPTTAAAYGVTNILDPTQNANAGAHLLADLLSEFGGNVQEALAAYDWGSGNVNNAISQYGSNWLSYAPSETQNYVASITGSVGSAPSATTASAAPASTVDDSGVAAEPVSQSGIGDIDFSDPTTYIWMAGALALAWILADLITE
jgi:hypothetical protein